MFFLLNIEHADYKRKTKNEKTFRDVIVVNEK